MAEKKSPEKDPTISTGSVQEGYPDGTHPLHPLAEQHYAAANKEYRDMPDDEKPDPSSVAQVEVLPDDK